MSRTYEVVIYTEEPSMNPDIMTEIGIVEELSTKKKMASIVYCRSKCNLCLANEEQ